MTFAEVLTEIQKPGLKACRKGWNGSKLEGEWSMFIEYDVGHAIQRLPHLVLTTPQGTQVPWLATSTDMFADDWLIE